jgi:NitT/TauT family transport system substrate-binding protein
MSIHRRLTRRRILAAAAFAGAGFAVPRLAFAQSKRAIKFTLPWVAEGSSLYTFVAKGMGFWEKHGLDVEIARGSGSVAAAQAIGEARFDFGMASPRSRSCRPSRGCRQWRSLPAHMTPQGASAY